MTDGSEHSSEPPFSWEFPAQSATTAPPLTPETFARLLADLHAQVPAEPHMLLLAPRTALTIMSALHAERPFTEGVRIGKRRLRLGRARHGQKVVVRCG